jgi:chromosome segregation ATPase
MDALEDKLSAQISRASQQGERLRDAALSRVETKLATTEATQPRMDRRIAELNGNYKGLSDEMQSQIRRIDAMDSRLWEWRQKADDELRNKLTGIEQNCQSVNSSLRVTKATTDDVIKKLNQRILSLEERMNERNCAAEETNAMLRALVQRVNEVEEARLADVSERFKQVERVGDSRTANQQSSREQVEGVATLEASMATVLKKIESIQQDSAEMHCLLQEQEEKLRSLRTLHEAKEEQYRTLSDRVERENWEGKFKDMTDKIDELDRRRIDNTERLEILDKRHDVSEQRHEELSGTVRKLQERPAFYPEVMAGEVDYSAEEGGEQEIMTDVPDIAAFGFRLTDSEERLKGFSAELSGLRQEVGQVIEMAPRLHVVMEQFIDVAPRIMAQENTVADLADKVRKLEGPQGDGVTGRVNFLEEELKRLAYTVEGGDNEEEDDEPGLVGGAASNGGRRRTASTTE